MKKNLIKRLVLVGFMVSFLFVGDFGTNQNLKSSSLVKKINYPISEAEIIEGKEIILERVSEDCYNWSLFNGDFRAYFSDGKVDSVHAWGETSYKHSIAFTLANKVDTFYFSYFNK